MSIDLKTGSLIAVGASAGASCRPCLEVGVAQALRSGANAGEVADAVAIGRKVRAAAESNFDAFAASLGVAPHADVVAARELRLQRPR